MTSVPASDADAAQLARNTLFTTDEIDLHSAEQGVQAAPDPTADDLRYTDVDVTTSGPLGLHIGPSDVTEPSSSERDAVEGVDASSSGGSHTSGDLILEEKASNSSLDVSSLNALDGSQSPLGRVLELPPAWELGGSPRRPAVSAPVDRSNNVRSITSISAALDAARADEVQLSDILDGGDLQSVPSDGAEYQDSDAKDAAQRDARAGDSSPGLGISTEPSPQRPQMTRSHDEAPTVNTDAPPSGQTSQGSAIPPATAAAPVPAPPPRPTLFAYKHDDSDTTMAELEEFFSYVEVHSVIEDEQDAWSRGAEAAGIQDWLTADRRAKALLISNLVERLEHRDIAVRNEASRRLAYIAHGTPICTTSPEHHLHMIHVNCTLLRSLGVLTAVHEALKAASGRWNTISAMTETDAPSHGPMRSPFHHGGQSQARQDLLEETNGELAILFSTLYFFVEIFRGDTDFAEELMTLDPPLPVYLLNLIASLRERNAKGYPVKKLLLLHWKSMLVCFGGEKDLRRVKKLVRSIEALPEDPAQSEEPAVPHNIKLKVSPLSYADFRTEMSAKYPTYAAPKIALPIAGIPFRRLVAAADSAPLRNGPYIGQSAYATPAGNSNPPGQTAPGPLPATPAPTPPPSPPPMKPKKQQYQTDQNRPFVLPFSTANTGEGYFSAIKGKSKIAVPFSIHEAGKLYERNMRFTTELWQMWKLREEYLADEAVDEGNDRVSDEVGTGLPEISSRLQSLRLDDGDVPRPPSETVYSDPQPDGLVMLYKLEKATQAEYDAHLASTSPEERKQGRLDKNGKKLHDKVMDVKRLQRVEIFYRSTLGNLQSAVIVLLKLLLATVTANTNNSANANSTAEPPEVQPPQSLEETDIMRHREITSKAVSAILINTLRWFKVSHAMKFHYLAHLLVDSNCLLLILKMFGLQEVSSQVRLRNEIEDWNFFQFCHLYGSSRPAPAKHDAAMSQIQLPTIRPANESSEGQPAGNPDEPEIITDFSGRNFFSVINFVHVLQKLTKHKEHRILLLVQYKSSAILKRITKVTQPLLQLYVLKVIKSQVPYCGRKWRQSNMKVITAIYLNCRPDLRDEWLTTIDIDNELDDTSPHEQTLRTLVKYYNTKHYGAFAPSMHRRTSSQAASANGVLDVHSMGQSSYGGPPHSGHTGSSIGKPSPGSVAALHVPQSPTSQFQNGQSFFDTVSFSSSRGVNSADSYRTSYIPDSLMMDGYLEDYEELLGDIFTPTYDAQGMPVSGPLSIERPAYSPGAGQLSHMSSGLHPRSSGDIGYMNSAEHAWHALGTILGESDSISDSESVGDMGYLDLDGDSDSESSDYSGDDVPTSGLSGWEHLSPDLAHAIDEEVQRLEDESRIDYSSPHRRRRSVSPRASPRLRRSSSSGTKSPALRPVLVETDDAGDDDEVAVKDDDDVPAYHIRSPRRSPHLSPAKPAIDEVEAFFE